MRIYPAIDIKDGKCVRLLQGDFHKVTVYHNEPEAVARRWEAAGASFIHVVDLDGARKGAARNSEAVKSIVEAVSVPVQIGGGVRRMKDVEDRLQLGVARVILGTAAVSDLGFVREAVREYGEKIAVGIDAKGGFVAVSGWEKTSGVLATVLCAQICAFGVKTVIYTDISRDGMMTGPNVQTTRELAEMYPVDVIASGGVSSMDDLRRVAETGCRGVIIGKALYEGAIDLETAVNTFEKDTGNL